MVEIDAIKLLNTMLHHRLHVQAALQKLIHSLERRSLVHDESKFRSDEFEGFSRINAAARNHPYGSPEYRAGLKQEKPTIDLHFSRNTHHPECHKPGTMGLLDLIEMTADWYAAWTVYEGQRAPENRIGWMENIRKQKERFVEGGLLSETQWWVVLETAQMLGSPEG